MIHGMTRGTLCLAAAIAAAAGPAIAQQGTGSTAKPAATSPAATSPGAQAPDSAKQPAPKSRFGRFGRVFHKAASTAESVGARAGVSKETAARLAITAATGGAAAAVLQARQQSALSAANLASQAISSRPHGAAPSAAADPARAAAIQASLNAPGSTALATQALHAMTDLGAISARAQQHDAAAMRGMQALNAAMAKQDAQFVALQKQAQAGDPTAGQRILIREDAIARAAMGGSAP